MIDVAFDTSVILTWLLQEPSWQRAHNLLRNPRVTPVLPGPTLTEVVMIARSKGNVSTGAQMLLALQGFGARVEHPVNDDLLRAAELLKVSQTHPGTNGATLSLGDASILAVVERLGIRVISKDQYWSELADAGHTTAAVLDY
jgi:PIN domain nuclease of toxin-antitoxin system